MKTYKIQLLTSTGLVTVNYTDDKDINLFEAELTAKYGNWITYKSEEVPPEPLKELFNCLNPNS